MRAARLLGSAAVLLAALAAAGCGGAGGAEVESAPRPEPATDYDALYEARLERDRSRFTEADVRFMTVMIGHHAQALAMASLAPTHGASPAVQTLAARIHNAQQDEIATMQRWLRDRGQPVPELHGSGLGIAVHGAEHADHAEHMPGMLTPAQLRELDRARGPEFDRLFLNYMIQHHRGAVTMVRALFATDGAGQDEEVFRFATDVQVDQITEIARMEHMLSQLGAD